MNLELVISLVLFSAILLYTWLKAREKVHMILETVYSSLNAVKQEDEDGDQDRPPSPDEESTIGGMKHHVGVAVFLIGVWVFVMGISCVLALYVLAFMAGKLYITNPPFTVLAERGKEFNAYLDNEKRTEVYGKSIEGETDIERNILQASEGPMAILQKFLLRTSLLASVSFISYIVVRIYFYLCISNEDLKNEQFMHTHMDAMMFCLLLTYILVLSYTMTAVV